MGLSPVYKEHRSETVYSTRNMGLSPVYITGNMGLSPVYKKHRSETVYSTRNMGLSPVYITGNMGLSPVYKGHGSESCLQVAMQQPLCLAWDTMDSWGCITSN